MRVHRFEEGFEDNSGSADADTRNYDRVNVPDGIHSMTIHQAEEGPHKFPDTNPGEFLNLTLKPQSHSHRFVFCNLGNGPQDRVLVSQLAQSLGMTADDWQATDPRELIGKIVRVETVDKLLKSGKNRVFVQQFLSQDEFKEKAKPAARTPAAKVEQARVEAGLPEGQGDDIPF